MINREVLCNKTGINQRECVKCEHSVEHVPIKIDDRYLCTKSDLCSTWNKYEDNKQKYIEVKCKCVNPKYIKKKQVFRRVPTLRRTIDEKQT